MMSYNKKGGLIIIECIITDLKHPEYNPRKISDKEMEDLKSSLKTFDCVEPAIINISPARKNIIIGGNQRIDAAKALGWEKFPCIEVSLSYEKERELNIRLNKNTGQWDFDILLDEFDNKDLIEWGFDESSLAAGLDFEAASQDEQGALDKNKEFAVMCPECKKVFDANEHKV